MTANATTRQTATTNILSVERPACHKGRNKDGRTIREVWQDVKKNKGCWQRREGEKCGGRERGGGGDVSKRMPMCVDA